MLDANLSTIQPSADNVWFIDGHLSRKVSFWVFKIFESQKGRTLSVNDILRLCTIVVNIAIRSCAKIKRN